MQPQPLILGLGQTGLSLVRYFCRQHLLPLVVDTRPDPPHMAQLQQEFPGIGCFLAGDFNPAQHHIASAWVSPGFPLQHPLLNQLQQANTVMGNDIALFVHQLAKSNPAAKLLAVTGTNGKSTVCTMLGQALTAAGCKTVVAGNIGFPVASLLDKALDAEVYVLELSSFQLIHLKGLAGHSGCILNLAEDHLDQHQIFAQYVASKQRIYSTSTAQICNSDDSATWVAPHLQCQDNRYWFGLTNPPPYDTRKYARLQHGQLCFGNEQLLALNQLPNPVAHNQLNALASIALLASIDRLDAAKNLAGYQPLPHRLQALGQKQGRWFVNDSKATNPHAAIHAITSLAQQHSRLVVIAGGDAKGNNLDVLGRAVQRHCHALIAIGKDAASLIQATAGITSVQASNISGAITQALALSARGDCIALCPGCASTDMFDNYAQRGEVFIKQVQAL